MAHIKLLTQIRIQLPVSNVILHVALAQDLLLQIALLATLDSLRTLSFNTVLNFNNFLLYFDSQPGLDTMVHLRLNAYSNAIMDSGITLQRKNVRYVLRIVTLVQMDFINSKTIALKCVHQGRLRVPL